MIVDATVWVAIFRENDVHHVAEALDQPLITLDREILERSSRVIEAEAPDDWVLRESSG